MKNKIINNIDLYKRNNRILGKFNNSAKNIFSDFIIIVFFLVFLLSLTSISFAQDSLRIRLTNNQSIKIDSITITGAKVTEEFVILRELNFSIGDSVNQKSLDYNKARVMSLRLFFSVEFNLFNVDGRNVLNINVKEGWYIFPIPFFNVQSNDISRSRYGVILNWRNFRGRNESIRAFFSLGYNPSYGLFYSNPVLISNTDISFFAGIAKQTLNNQSKIAESLAGADFDYKVFNVYVGLGFRLNPYNIISFRFGYNYIKSPIAQNRITASGNDFDKVPLLTLSFKHDTRDLKQFPEDGLFTSAFITHKGFGSQNISYFITGFDFREYRKLFFKNLTTKWRIAYRKIFGNNKPLYDDSYLGFREFVRGHKNDEREGNNSLISSLELSYPLIKEFGLSLKLPLLPQSLTSYLISIRLSIFGDTGVTYDNGEKIMINKFDSGYGIGLTILFLPYNAFRFEYAFNEFGKGEFLFGTKFSF